MNNSGFYNVHQVKVKNKKNKKGIRLMWEYKVNNKIVKDTIRATNLSLLKLRVLDKGYLWGIVDMEKAKKSASKSKVDNIKYLVGRYGEQL